MRHRDRTTSLSVSEGTRSRLLSLPEQIQQLKPFGEIDALSNRISGSTWSNGTTSSGSIGVLGAGGILEYQTNQVPRRDWFSNGTRVSGYSLNYFTVTNLLRFTDTLGTGWVTSGLSIAAGNVSGPDGLMSAKRITNSANPATLTYTRGAVGAGSKYFTVWLRRNAGSGDVEIAANTAAYTKVTVTETWQRFVVVASVSLIVGIRITIATGTEIDVYAPTAVLNTYHRGMEIINPTASDLTRSSDVVTIGDGLAGSSSTSGTVIMEACITRGISPLATENPYIALSKNVNNAESMYLSIAWTSSGTSLGIQAIDDTELNEVNELVIGPYSDVARIAMSWNSSVISYAVDGGNAASVDISSFVPFVNQPWFFNGSGGSVRYAAVYDQYVDPTVVSALSRRMT